MLSTEFSVLRTKELFLAQHPECCDAGLEPHLWFKVSLCTKSKSKQNKGKKKANGQKRGFREKRSREANSRRNITGNGPKEFFSPQIHLSPFCTYFFQV